MKTKTNNHPFGIFEVATKAAPGAATKPETPGFDPAAHARIGDAEPILIAVTAAAMGTILALAIPGIGALELALLGLGALFGISARFTR